ncbi:MAG: glycosyltransferase [Flavobacteriaceae bacterium]
MKILLVGEYSRLHNSLKEGLTLLGYKVLLVSTGDFFKDYPSDIKLKRNFDTGFLKKIKVIIFKVFKIDITSLSVKNQFFKHKKEFKGFDIVQLINESPFTITPKYEQQIIAFLKKYNTKLFLLSCGTDFISVSYALSRKLPYSILKEYIDGIATKNDFEHSLKYVTPPYQKLHRFVLKNIEGIISTDLDYHIPMMGHQKYLGMIPNPININTLPVIELPVDQEIKIFLGINRSNYNTKGIKYFEEALQFIKLKYAKKVEIKIVESLPYKEYIKSYNESHIILDQVLGMDQGYNALEAMAKGKVVFTGAEKEWLSYYQLEENTIAINAVPDAEKIANELSILIENPSKIIEIGANARRFIEEYHHLDRVTKMYLGMWNTSIKN